MKPLILMFCLLVVPAVSLAHGYPTIEEFQTFPGTVITQSFANITGGVVAIPFAIVGCVIGAVASPFYGGDFSENITAGFVFIGMTGYVVGQQIAWPIYGIEKGVEWIAK